MKQEVADDGAALPLDVCYILREGDDVTIVTWGAMTVDVCKRPSSSQRKASAPKSSISPPSVPIDAETILESVAKTGRLVIVHEAARNCGVGAEIAAIVAEHGLYDLHGADPARHRLRHGHAAVSARERLHSQRRAHSSTAFEPTFVD